MSLSIEQTDFIVKEIQRILKKPVEIILFGSYAKGTQGAKSDIDIALRQAGPIDPALWSLIEEVFEQSDFTQSFDIVDYHRVKPDFQKVIDQEGKPLDLSKSEINS